MSASKSPRQRSKRTYDDFAPHYGTVMLPARPGKPVAKGEHRVAFAFHSSTATRTELITSWSEAIRPSRR